MGLWTMAIRVFDAHHKNLNAQSLFCSWRVYVHFDAIVQVFGAGYDPQRKERFRLKSRRKVGRLIRKKNPVLVYVLSKYYWKASTLPKPLNFPFFFRHPDPMRHILPFRNRNRCPTAPDIFQSHIFSLLFTFSHNCTPYQP